MKCWALHLQQNHIQQNCTLFSYSLNKKEWICSLFKEWILEKSEIRVNLEWITQMFTPNSLFSKIHSLKSEHIHSFLFREYLQCKYEQSQVQTFWVILDQKCENVCMTDMATKICIEKETHFSRHFLKTIFYSDRPVYSWSILRNCKTGDKRNTVFVEKSPFLEYIYFLR